MVTHLWHVEVKKATGKVVPGMWVEVVKSGTNAPPVIREIDEAFVRKYGIKLPGGCSLTCFDIKEVK